MYCLVTCVHDHMLAYIWEARTLKQAWDNLKMIFAANTTARKLQLCQERHVCIKVHLEDQGYVRLTHLNQRQHR